MKQYMTRILVALILLLLLGLTWLWVDVDGVRNTQWQEPEPRKPDFASMIPALPSQNAVGVNQFVATLDRPLFSPSRRPPPPPPPPPKAAEAPPPDPLANIELYGVISSADGGGIVAKIDGKPQRVHVNENIGAWTLQSVDNRDATLIRDGETRVLHLAHAKVVAPAPTPAAVAPMAGAPAASPAGAAAAPTAAKQEQEEYIRNRKALRNAARAKAGLPPLP